MSNESLIYNESEPGALYKLYAAVGQASAEFPDLPRTATGQVGKDRKFQYAPYHKVVRCIKPSLAKQGVTFLQPLHTEEDGKVSITLIVAGHGAVIASTVKFDKNSDVKVFGADTTYHKRYQLTAFFGLEGDPDADDFEDSVLETQAKVSKIPQAEPKRAVVAETKVVENVSKPSAENDYTPVRNEETPKTDEQDREIGVSRRVQKDTRSIGDKLNDAMKQLKWTIPDFDAFCKEHLDEFPNFVSAAKLPPNDKVKLWELLVLHKNVVPFYVTKPEGP